MTAFTDAMPLTVPGPRPILGGYGNLLRLVRDPVRTMGEQFRRCGPVANLAAGARVRLFSPLLFLNDYRKGARLWRSLAMPRFW
jgi:hypothetical protein